MKKVVSSLAIIGMLAFGFNSFSYAQENEEAPENSQEQVDENEIVDEDEVIEAVSDETDEMSGTTVAEGASTASSGDEGFIQTLKREFIIGDPFWMGIVLVCLIVGTALCIERIVYLNLSSINTKRFVDEVEGLLAKGNVNGAKDLARNTRGPIASIYYQGLTRADEGAEAVEKAVVSYGGVQMGLLEKGISWISLFIALSPMLGFMGTVVGMIQAFAKIVEDGQVSPITVAGGIQVALLTTLFGLIAAIILQVFYNYIISKVDSLVNEMEDSSISLVDMMIEHKISEH